MNFRSCKNLDEQVFRDHLASAPWHVAEVFDDVDDQSEFFTTSFPGSLFSASIVVEKRPWLSLVTCLPESGRFTKCVLGDGWQCRPCRHCGEGNQHAFDFVAR